LSEAEPRITEDEATAITHAIYQLTEAVEELYKKYITSLSSKAAA
jgi:hypothetical protein